MKKIYKILILICIIIPNVVYGIGESASSYILMDQDSHRVLLNKNMNEQRLIASITKIMTCLLAIESNRLDETIIVDESILKAYGSGIYIEIGEEITLRDLLYGLMLRSGNDAALMISNYISNSEENFVKLMNYRAKEIGMKNTIFNNSSGLDNKIGNYSTAYDMALLTSYAMKYDEYKNIVKTKKHIVKTNKKTYIWYNKNKLLDTNYITGGKTGWTEKAKRTLVTTATKNNINLVAVTLNDGNDWETHKKLYEYAFENYQNYRILNKNTYYVKNENYYNKKLYINNDVYLPLKENEIDKIYNNIKIYVIKNVKNNDIVGENNIYINDQLLLSIPIYIQKDKEVKENFFDKIKKWLKIWQIISYFLFTITLVINMKIYLDVIFFINVLFDASLLFCVGIILKRKVPIKRIILSSIIGGLSIFILFIKVSSFLLLLIKIIIGILLVIIAFGYKNIYWTLKNFLNLIIVSILLGGFLYLLNIQLSYKSNGIIFFHNGLSPNIVLSLIISPILLYIYVKQFKKNKDINSKIFNIDIYFKDNRKININGYLDTGNNLYDPYKKRPIILVYDKYLKSYYTNKDIILVPYETLNNTGLLECIKIDKIYNKKIGYQKNILVGISHKKFKIEEIGCILHNSIIGD